MNTESAMRATEVDSCVSWQKVFSRAWSIKRGTAGVWQRYMSDVWIYPWAQNKYTV